MSSAIVLPQSITYGRAEEIFRRSKSLAFQERPDPDLVSKALRIVRARDGRMMLALEHIVKVLTTAYEEQLGEWQRQGSRTFAEKPKPEVLQAFEQAYKNADKGVSHQELQVFGWLYVAVAEFAGFVL